MLTGHRDKMCFFLKCVVFLSNVLFFFEMFFSFEMCFFEMYFVLKCIFGVCFLDVF